MFKKLARQGGTLHQPDFLFLLIALALLLLVVPLIEHQLIAVILKEAGLTAVLITAIVANRSRRHVLRFGIAVAAASISLGWVTVFWDSAFLTIISYLVSTVFLATIAGMILISVLRDHMAGMQAIFGAICVYLLIGLIWALLYSAAEYLQQDAFAIAHRSTEVLTQDPREMTSFSQMTYFSFVTMTSLGYGDITPKTPLARSLTWSQAVLGQLYLTVLIARLVGLLPRADGKKSAA